LRARVSTPSAASTAIARVRSCAREFKRFLGGAIQSAEETGTKC
jgi:hypothetical protein